METALLRCLSLFLLGVSLHGRRSQDVHVLVRFCHCVAVGGLAVIVLVCWLSPEGVVVRLKL